MEVENNSMTMEQCMLQGDIAIQKLKQESIIIVGNSRIGKSTLFNHLLNIPMKGIEDQRTGEVTIQTCFQEGVKAQDTYRSVTLVPNISKVKINGVEYGLCDTAGFEDEGRSYSGVFGVSYLLDKILEKVKRPKFLLVIASTKFDDAQITELLRPIQTFLRLINIDTLISNEEVKEKIINSIAIVSIKTTRDLRRHLGKLNKAIEHLQTLGDNISNERRICLQIIKSIRENNRIQLFREAVEQQTLQKSNILENLLRPETKWASYDQQDLDKEHVFRLPLQEDFLKLNQTNKDLYREYSNGKRDFMTKSFQLVQKLVKKGIDNWHSKSAIDFQAQFNEIQIMIQNHRYGQFDTMLKLLQIEQGFTKNNKKEKSVSRLQLLTSLTQLQQKAIEFNQANTQGTELEKISKIIDPCVQTFDICRKVFCQTYEQQKTFIIFMFMNYRSLLQNRVQIKIHPEENTGSIFIVMNTLSNILPESMVDLKARFIQNFSPMESEREQFGTLLQETIQNINNITDPEQGTFVLKSSVKITMISAYALMKRGSHLEALQKLTEAFNQFKEYEQTLPDQSNRDQQTNQYCEFKKLQIYKKMAQCLQNLKLNSLALSIYEHTQSVSLSMKCYKRMILESSQKKKKFENMQTYAKFLDSKGKKQKLIQLYEQMIDQFECFPTKRKEIKCKLEAVLTSDFTNQLQSYAVDLGRDQIVKINEQIIQNIVDEIGLYTLIQQSDHEEDIDEVFMTRNQDQQPSFDGQNEDD